MASIEIDVAVVFRVRLIGGVADRRPHQCQEAAESIVKHLTESLQRADGGRYTFRTEVLCDRLERTITEYIDDGHTIVSVSPVGAHLKEG